MLAANPLYARHFVQPVPAREAAEVRLFVGSQRQTLKVGRPMDFGALTLLSNRTCSKQTVGMDGPGLRAAARRAISNWCKPLETGYFLDTRHVEPNDVSHMLMDIIPLCLAARRTMGDVTCVFRALQPRFRELVWHFGIRPVCTSRPVSGEKLSFRLSRGLAQFGIEGPFDAPLYSYTGEVYADHIRPGKGPAKLFISRRGPQCPDNAAELEAFLEARDFTVVYLEDLPAAEQIALMQGADQVVAIHGGALAYLALKERTSAVVEILPPNVYHDHFPVGIGHKVGRYIQLIPRFDENVQFQGWPAIYAHKQSPFGVDLGQLEEALDECDRAARDDLAARAAWAVSA